MQPWETRFTKKYLVRNINYNENSYSLGKAGSTLNPLSALCVRVCVYDSHTGKQVF
jgi:hypothetical protein